MEHKWVLSDAQIRDLSIHPPSKEHPLIDQYDDEYTDSGTYRLRIGAVYRAKRVEEPWPTPDGRSWLLGSFQMALVVTREELHIPVNCLGIVFGTNTLAAEGLLVVNPGMITAGHNRAITFYVINFGKNAMPLRQGDPIARIMFVAFADTNGVNPRNLPSDPHRTAAKQVHRLFFAGLGGYFQRMLRQKIWLEFGIAAFVVGVFFTMISLVAPILADFASSVPDLRREVQMLTETVETMQTAAGNTDVGDNEQVVRPLAGELSNSQR